MRFSRTNIQQTNTNVAPQTGAFNHPQNPVQASRPTAQPGGAQPNGRFSRRTFSTHQRNVANEEQGNQNAYEQQNVQYENNEPQSANKVETVQSTHTAESVRVTKILPKFVNRSNKSSIGTAIEFNSGAFGLGKINSQGYRDNMDGKMLMNFWNFDTQTNKQLDLIPTFIDISEWLNVCHMILSGRLHEITAEAREKQAQGGYAYCGYVYQNNGGSYKPIFKLKGKEFGGKNNPIATVFKITPAKKDNSWVFSSEIYEGVSGANGLIEIKSGTRPITKIQVLLGYDDLVRIARMSEMAIQSYMMRYFSE